MDLVLNTVGTPRDIRNKRPYMYCSCLHCEFELNSSITDKMPPELNLNPRTNTAQFKESQLNMMAIAFALSVL